MHHKPSAPIAWDAREGHEYREILCHQAEGIAKLTINRPEFCISALQSAMRGYGRPEIFRSYCQIWCITMGSEVFQAASRCSSWVSGGLSDTGIPSS